MHEREAGCLHAGQALYDSLGRGALYGSLPTYLLRVTITAAMHPSGVNRLIRGDVCDRWLYRLLMLILVEGRAVGS